MLDPSHQSVPRGAKHSKACRSRILIVVSAEWYFLSHRLALGRYLRDRGWDVVVAAAVERGGGDAIEAEGFRFVPLRLDRHSVDPRSESSLFWELVQLYRRERPCLVHHVTIKPVLYGSLAAKLVGIPAVVNAISGLGYTFLRPGLRGRALQWMVSAAYRVALSGRRVRVIFQNPDDRELFIARRAISPDRAVLIRGVGVSTVVFSPAPEPPGPPVVVLASRLLWDKGIRELVEASRLLKCEGVLCRVVLVGVPDSENPNSIAPEILEGWQAEGVIEWWGLRSDMPDVLKNAAIAVLPSYREGLPRFLVEAAATGRPLVATDVPGCREIVRHGENGLLVPPRDARALADAIGVLVGDPALRARMGAAGREMAVTEFSEESIAAATCGLYHELLANVPGTHPQ